MVCLDWSSAFPLCWPSLCGELPVLLVAASPDLRAHKSLILYEDRLVSLPYSMFTASVVI